MTIANLPAELVHEIIDNLLHLTSRETAISNLSLIRGSHRAYPEQRAVPDCSYCTQEHDLAALARTCRRVHAFANPALYTRNAKHHDGFAVFHAAARGHIRPLELLFRAGADIDVLNLDADLRRWHFGEPGHHDSGRHLVTGSGLAGLRDASWQDRRDYFVRRLPPGSAAAAIAATGNDVPAVELFKTIRYATPLHYAARSGQDQAVAWLLDHGADIDGPARGFCACEVRRRRTLAPGAWPENWRVEPDTPDVEVQWTPLHTALCCGRETTALLLVERGAGVILCDQRDAFSPVAPPERAEVFTALALACERAFDHVVRAIPKRFREEHAETIYTEWFTRTNRCLYEAIVEVNAGIEVVAAQFATQRALTGAEVTETR